MASGLRLLALRDLRTLCVRRVALQAPEVTQSNLIWDFFPLYKYCKRRLTNNFSYGAKIFYSKSRTLKTPCQLLEGSL